MNWFFDASICFGAGAPQIGWTVGPAILLPLIAVALLYAGGAWRLFRRSSRAQGLRLQQAWLFAAGWAALAITLVTPLHAWSEHLFTAHMIEHELMMIVAAPLIVASGPGAAMMWGLPRSWRRGLGRLFRFGALSGLWRHLTRPAVATVLHGIAIWVWHVPGLFEAALERGFLHYAQHASFFGTALLFWWVMLPRRGGEQGPGASVAHFFLTSMHTSLLGVLLLLSPRLWYPENSGLSELWGLSPLEDQQLAGLVMWVPGGLAYGGAALLLAGLWIKSSSKSVEGTSHALPAR